ncbi:MAG: anthranilate synthase component I family protein [Saprospiraceae bacterium]
MFVRPFDHLGSVSLIDLALRIPQASLLAGWEVLDGNPRWHTLAVDADVERITSIESLAFVLANRSIDRSDKTEREYPPFTTGICSHFSYEAASLLEASLQLPNASGQLPILSYAAYDATVSTHVCSGKTCIYASTTAAADRLEAILTVELSKSHQRYENYSFDSSSESDIKQEAYQRQVEDIRQRILAGDFFQANLTRMLTADLGTVKRAQLSGFAERFLTQSRAPFGAILNFPNATVISASPERFFRIENSTEGRRIFAEPIKGTRPRHEEPNLDETAKNDLLNSEKDRAENIMIADLVRNDLSRICTDESILADTVCELRSFATVHHLVTRVSGMLKDEVSNLDALLAQFPCGSITGAPKWAAMDAIAELEQRERGIYCGTIGYFDDRGHADFSVAIRTAVASFSESGTKLTYGTGGGITMLSDPEEEFTETEDKAAGFLRALQP